MISEESEEAVQLVHDVEDQRGEITNPRSGSRYGAAFPPDFAWGVATSAYQIEGAIHAGGRGASIWDTFAQRPGAILGGDTGDVADDHYARFRDDVALMVDLGIRAYRFSIAWPRIQPSGAGRPVQAGLDFYRRLIDALDEAGIEPYPTLYHWDLPQALEDAGGWPNRDTAHRFADYATIVGRELRGRARFWSTINEPWCAAFLGYASGIHAPGIQDPAKAIAASHHLLLGHGLAARALRAEDDSAQVGIVFNPMNYRVAETSDEDRLADQVRRLDGIRNRLFADSVLRGTYPDDVVADLRPFGELPVRDGDLATISTPLAWLGINYYFDQCLTADAGAPADPVAPGVAGIREMPAVDPTDLGWPVTPSGLGDLLIGLRAAYPNLPPLFVCENGAAYDDPPGPDGVVDDRRRVAYLDAHVRQLRRAIAAGVDLRGYFVWSLLDNFEWAAGYAARFGLVHVDFATQVRTPRASARWYRDLIAGAGIAQGG